ncbi:hypothetical protein PHLGIDRAFT_400628 [Phlebiopsis gigantea 11061_1 CR5-6]|uniref:Uncharacterized protein n=1 Tax=Phlebiopsis gigantea (strain 11061_1 CR5-6) TaxID=745531 RepID=A0A0C3P2E9_PHLG1|nr:hypothetical protein PHLGIDRAFT_400628 [Phlebiopsis gigantea 11061_1 CR5-6]
MSRHTFNQNDAGSVPRPLPSTPVRSENAKDRASPAQLLKTIAIHASARKARATPPPTRHPFGDLTMNTPTNNIMIAKGVSTVATSATAKPALAAEPTSKSILKHVPSTGATLGASVSWCPSTHVYPLVRTSARRPTKREVLYETAQPRLPSPVRPATLRDRGPSGDENTAEDYAARYLAGQVPPPSLPLTGFAVVEPPPCVDAERSMSEDVARALAGMYGLLAISSLDSRSFEAGASALEPGSLSAAISAESLENCRVVAMGE